MHKSISWYITYCYIATSLCHFSYRISFNILLYKHIWYFFLIIFCLSFTFKFKVCARWLLNYRSIVTVCGLLMASLFSIMLR